MYIRDYSRRLYFNIKYYGLRCNPSCFYIYTDSGLCTRFMHAKYHHFACFHLSIYLYVLFMCLYVRAYKKKYTVLEIRKRSQTYRNLDVLHFITCIPLAKAGLDVCLLCPSIRLSLQNLLGIPILCNLKLEKFSLLFI